MSDRRPYKIRHTMQYTEVVYHNALGEEVGRERVHDDHLYDSGGPESLTEQETAEWVGEEDDGG